MNSIDLGFGIILTLLAILLGMVLYAGIATIVLKCDNGMCDMRFLKEVRK